ncbi:MAG: GNAT family N-acetyltransferase [Actinobacteria bacterium]|nr:GNAT family N-acetyltransferase [Actinomycetota bacterium]
MTISCVQAHHSEISVRDATPADARAIARVGRVAFPRAHAGILDEGTICAVVEQAYAAPALRRCIEGCAKDRDAQFLVAQRQGEVVGYLYFDTVGGGPELHQIYVDPRLTGTGIGATLIGELHRRLSPGSSYILMVAAANHGALRFYARHGFVEEARVDGREFYREHMGVKFSEGGPPVPALVLRCTVPGELGREGPVR